LLAHVDFRHTTLCLQVYRIDPDTDPPEDTHPLEHTDPLGCTHPPEDTDLLEDTHPPEDSRVPPLHTGCHMGLQVRIQASPGMPPRVRHTGPWARHLARCRV
jgi:hypothetical protein